MIARVTTARISKTHHHRRKSSPIGIVKTSVEKSIKKIPSPISTIEGTKNESEIFFEHTSPETKREIPEKVAKIGQVSLQRE